MPLKHRWSILAGGICAACAAAGPSPELVDARRAYDDATRSKAAQLAPDQLLEARQALERAEAEHGEEPGSMRERNLAYIAHRRSLEAIAEGEIGDARRQIAQAESSYRETQDALRLQARRDLDRTRQELSLTAQQLATVRSQLRTQGETIDETAERLREQERLLAERKVTLEAQQAELETEREARKRAEAQAAAAIASLTEIARVQEEQRGTVITIPGSVLFLTGRSNLLPVARQRLQAVADALKLQEDDRTIVVEGHTDSRGSDEMNMRLSRERAESVRAFLVEQGLDPDRIQAVGRGEEMPIADNDSPEGRANNRRVEIVIQNPRR
jgi:outer membrane protein OmpA-like peptidoglycan-associated protein